MAKCTTRARAISARVVHDGWMENVTIAHAPERQRYIISVGGEPVGLSKYRESGGQRDFVHTEVDSEFQGHGLASQLIRWALDDTRASGLRIVAHCPMVAAFVGKHRDYDDILDQTDVAPG